MVGINLTTAYNISTNGLKKTEAEMSVVSSNISNADKAGYTKKTYQAEYVTTSAGTYSNDGTIQGMVNRFLEKSVVSEINSYGKNTVIADYLASYTDSLGDLSSDSGISASLNDFSAAIAELELNPESSSAKSEVIDAASRLATNIKSISNTIQDLRKNADSEIATTVNNINDILEQLKGLNDKIAKAEMQHGNSADLEDQRTLLLEELSQYTSIQYTYTSDNQLRIYSKSGDALLDTSVHKLQFTAASSINGDSSYPTNLSGVTLDGKDITSELTSGKLGGLIELRDSTLVSEHQKLDEFSKQLIEHTNEVYNKSAGTSKSKLESTLSNLSASTSLSATGSFRIAVINGQGDLQSYADIDLSGINNMSELLAELNNISGISANITNGKLNISSTDSANYIAINEMDSSIASDTGDKKGFSYYFGFNNFFKGDDAENISIDASLKSNPYSLNAGKLSDSATLATGDRVISSGDGSTIADLSALLNTDVSFGSTSEFGSRSGSFANYLSDIISTASQKSSSAERAASLSSSAYQTVKDKLTNSTGVNIDEETANMITIENAYKANASVMSTIREMFDALLETVRS